MYILSKKKIMNENKLNIQKDLICIQKRYNKGSNVANLYDILVINKNASIQEIETAFRKQAKFYDPEITGNNNNI